MKRGILGLISLTAYGALLYLGSLYQEHLKHIASTTYDPYPSLLFTSLFPIVFGMLLALPHLYRTVRGEGRLGVDIYRLVLMGIPTLYVAAVPLLVFSPVGRYLVTSYIFFRYNLLTFAAGAAFGYILVTSFKKGGQHP
ncbi:MAG: hypothetical protein HPY50_12335 [Firmicutes bacterium]|nr:hypothetical protein [Bacillota bacterium]